MSTSGSAQQDVQLQLCQCASHIVRASLSHWACRARGIQLLLGKSQTANFTSIFSARNLQHHDGLFRPTSEQMYHTFLICYDEALTGVYYNSQCSHESPPSTCSQNNHEICTLHLRQKRTQNTFVLVVKCPTPAN